jgi:L-lactate utilization protein LutB
MEKAVEEYWKLRLSQTQHALEKNNFEVHVAGDGSQARDMVLKDILPKIAPASVSWGGSLTLVETGLYEAIKNEGRFKVLDTFDKNIPREEMLEMRRQALLVDLFITGTNAVTETGRLVNLDMYGNRVAAIAFGPKNVVILVGRNKIVSDIEEAMFRIKEYAAPVNAMRLDKKTPCAKTSRCEECASPDRICNVWTITEKSLPKGRIKIVLINQGLGY